MAASFGVQLKKPGMEGETKGLSPTPGGALRSDFKTKPVSDLKAMFNKKDEEAKSSEIVTKKATTATTGQRSNFSKNTKTESSKTNCISNFSTTASKYSRENGGPALSEEDKKAFALLKDKLSTTDIDKLDSKEPVIAVSKTFGGGNAYKATFDTGKVQRAGEDSNKPATKTEAASILSFSLTKLRTRPGSLKSEENSLDNTTKNKDSLRSQSPSQLKEMKKDKYIPGVAKGWKGSGDDETDSKAGKFHESSVGKVRTEIKTEKETKVKGFRSVSPVNLRRTSSDDSSGSVNLSPRGYKPNTDFFDRKDKDDKKTDINKNIKKNESNRTDQGVFKSKVDNQNQFKKDTQKNRNSTGVMSANKIVLSSKSSDAKGSGLKGKLSAVEQLAQDRERIKANRNSGSFSSDSEKGKRSPKTKGEFKWMDKSRISLEEFKEQRKFKTDLHKPLSRASSSGSSSSLSRSDASDIKSRIERFGSPDSRDSVPTSFDQSPAHSPVGNSDVRKRDYVGSKKINPNKFKDIKKGFETGHLDTGTSSHDNKPQLRIKTEKKLIERKQSFEGGDVYKRKSYERREVISPRDKGSVLQTVKALTELDAKAKAQPVVMRRTQSLASESLDEDNDSSTYEEAGQYYDEIQGMRMGDDVSNEGDISSEADLIYEEIPANMTDEKG